MTFKECHLDFNSLETSSVSKYSHCGRLPYEPESLTTPEIPLSLVTTLVSLSLLTSSGNSSPVFESGPGQSARAL
jgi:hypothetical protein